MTRAHRVRLFFNVQYREERLGDILNPLFLSLSFFIWLKDIGDGTG